MSMYPIDSYTKEDLILKKTENNSKNKKTPLQRKDPIFDKNENKIEDQKSIKIEF